MYKDVRYVQTIIGGPIYWKFFKKNLQSLQTVCNFALPAILLIGPSVKLPFDCQKMAKNLTFFFKLQNFFIFFQKNCQ